MATALSEAILSESFEYQCGTTRVGQTGWVAWLDGPTRKIHVRPGKCIGHCRQGVTIRTDDGEIEIDVPHGRMDCTPNLALDQLAIDLRTESENAMKPLQEALGGIARMLLLDLVAVEMAKTKSGQPSDRNNLEDGIRKIGHH